MADMIFQATPYQDLYMANMANHSHRPHLPAVASPAPEPTAPPPSLDRIHQLTDNDYATMGGLVGMDLGQMRQCLTGNIPRLTIPKLKLVFHYLCDRFRVRKSNHNRKDAWVQALTSFLHQSASRIAAPMTAARSSIPPSHGILSALSHAHSPAPVPLRPAGNWGGQPAQAPGGNPQTMAGAQFGLTLPIGAEAHEKMYMHNMVKVERAMKHIPPSFHFFHDLMNFIHFKEIPRFNRITSFYFRIPASIVPSIAMPPRNKKTRCFLCLFADGFFQPNSVGVSIDQEIVNMTEKKTKAENLKNMLVVNITDIVRNSLRNDPSAATSGRKMTMQLSPRIPMTSEVVAVVMLCEKLDLEQCTAKFYEHVLKAKAPNINPLNPIHLFPAFRRSGEGAQRDRDWASLQETLTNMAAAAVPKVEVKKVEDDEVEMGDTILSLQDPLTLGRIEHPAKGSRCMHEQCFDAMNFLQCMETADVWKCVVCNKVVAPMELTLDTRFLELLRKYKSAERCVIRADGTDAPVEELKPDRTKHGKQNRSDSPDSCSSGPTLAPAPPPPKRAISEVICLDSDEEDDPGGQATQPSDSSDVVAPPSKRPRLDNSEDVAGATGSTVSAGPVGAGSACNGSSTSGVNVSVMGSSDLTRMGNHDSVCGSGISTQGGGNGVGTGDNGPMIGFMGMGMGMGNHGGIPKVGMRSNSGGINKMEMGSDGSGIGTPLLIDQTNRGMQPWAGPPARVVGQFNGGGFASYGGIGRFGSAGLQNGGGALQHMRAHNTGAPAHPGGPNHGVPGVNGGIGGQQGFTGKQETADPGFYSFDQMFF